MEASKRTRDNRARHPRISRRDSQWTGFQCVKEEGVNIKRWFATTLTAKNIANDRLDAVNYCKQ